LTLFLLKPHATIMFKKYLKIVLKLALAILVILVFKTLYIAGSFKSIVNYNAGKTSHIYTNMPGTEDLAYDKVHNLLFISSANRWATTLKNENPLDGIYVLNMDSLNQVPKKILTTYSGDLHPHGISVLQQEGSTYLFVVNHNKTGNYIEKFKFENGTLMHLKSYANTLLFSPNDVTAVSDSTFYATNDHGSKTALGTTLEGYLQLPRSYVVYFNGHKYTKVIKKLKYANGVILSRDKKKLYVATSTGQKILIYSRQENGNLNLEHYINTHTGNDNITIDNNNDLWIGAHPKLLKFTGHAKDSTKISPSEVLRIHRRDDGIYTQKVFYLNDGQEISGSSVAYMFADNIYVGDVFQHKLLRIALNK
jgi:arylesterase / paraoxonase